MSKEQDLKKSIEKIIQDMMERVIYNITIKRPFIPDEHYAKKPLYAALVPDTIFKGSHFERSFVTSFGGVWQKLAYTVGLKSRGTAFLEHSIKGTVRQGQLKRIQEVLNDLDHKKVDGKKIKPNWVKELNYILEGKGNPIPVEVIADLFVHDNDTNESFAFELKAPLPNSDQTKVSKEKIFKLLCMENSPINEAFYCLPYNPYGKKEDYAWSFPMRWFDMHNDPCVLIGNEFWDKLGGTGTYKNFISIVTALGKGYHDQIYREYLGLEMPENYQYFKLE